MKHHIKNIFVLQTSQGQKTTWAKGYHNVMGITMGFNAKKKVNRQKQTFSYLFLIRRDVCHLKVKQRPF